MIAVTVFRCAVLVVLALVAGTAGGVVFAERIRGWIARRIEPKP